MAYISTKTYDHNLGLSVAFRQHTADSHCRFLHGYAMAVRFEFEADELDERNWVVDFGSLSTLKGWLQGLFDHKLIIAEDDPEREYLEDAGRRGVADVVVVPAISCERFAEMIFEATDVWLKDNGYAPRVRTRLVEVKEHGANSAIFMGPSSAN